MLRIQSLALRHVLNRRELHTCFPGKMAKTKSPKTSVTSLDKRDRQSLFQRTEISSDPASSAAHVSLSSHLQLSNNRRPKVVTKSRSKLPPRATNQQSPIRLISLERETSSPAAPPPSFSEWAYRTN
ncbi:hypothetical protein, partial [Rhizobium vallis]|uniref:hypothetical protein n=1 Tax=Rhizobium vallis TaxID=634290 RepID=UPI001ABFFB0D